MTYITTLHSAVEPTIFSMKKIEGNAATDREGKSRTVAVKYSLSRLVVGVLAPAGRRREKEKEGEGEITSAG